MVDALIALLIALLLIFVFKPPAWVGQVATVGGVAFVCWVVIIIIRAIINR